MKLFHKIRDLGEDHAYDGMQPAIKSSICTGEKVAGFLDAGGKFLDVMLVAGEDDLTFFCRKYGVKREEIRHVF
ncbi:MAG TPA: aspartate dehydrogenase [Candidatus Eisenbergiella merdipullorum]|uniref:Aspartate dehydrogenase n=1 Tax=Candidatus Eisenbergiella merdipullorum TaxID=2838553 RepID=A0A9D2L2L2_9FIRM|nr:aspartate dehydrogenase [Candidatus Eisenbergiella merdipullorum]